MSVLESQELENWKEELEDKKKEIFKKRNVIEKRVEKFKVRLSIINSLNSGDQYLISNQVMDKLKTYESELAQFDGEHNIILNEINSILQKLK